MVAHRLMELTATEATYQPALGDGTVQRKLDRPRLGQVGWRLSLSIQGGAEILLPGPSSLSPRTY
ncbi:hypothetical protein CG51_15870 [Haematobacter missouriensis]|uniref:Uncharacterized protein n=1 Tax=Haematobacter missouriensis TaxID=366616 RepID=A0A212AYR5_9RHOB|nr:hypothetical protein [Haematobacter missouriensis]KFI33191.1 hypothetical protein CG51_15870 [Haematobacter missouriensis]OWJ79850.1 hypothetical protein CDV53_00855 [Haematobacter missouriensis]OWJ86604.1 hypothetical protein CDV52_01230 [Haematobacter missouriensis]